MRKALSFAFLALVLTTFSAERRTVRFTAFDIFVDSKRVPLAAYQIEFAGPADTVRITGIEGGEHAAFKTPPFYDPEAMQQERVILAAFNNLPPEKLPTGRTRVATIHLQFEGLQPPEFSLRPHTAANVEGKAIAIETTFSPRNAYE